MNFANSEHFLWLWLLPLGALILAFEHRRITRRLGAYSKRLSELLSHEWSWGRSFIKALLFLAALGLIICALARPRWGFEWRELPRGGVDIMVVLDLSQSMLATDIKPSRLERAKRELIDLVNMLQGDRIGIVAFAGVPFVQTPLTVDYRLAQTFITQLNPDLIPVPGTDLGAAISKASKHLVQAATGDSQGKAIILITDGEDQGGNALRAAKEAHQAGIRIYAIGIGDPQGAPIPAQDGGFKKDSDGNVVLSKLDTSTLIAITDASGGMYVRSTSGDLDLDRIYRQGIRKVLAPENYGVSRQKVWHERFWLFVLFALLTLLIEGAIEALCRHRGRKKSRGLSSLLLVLLILQPLKGKADPSKGLEAFAKKDYSSASEHFLEAKIDAPNDLRHSYNLGVSYFHEDKLDAAANAFRRAAQSQDPELSFRANYNLGNTEVSRGNLSQAQTHYTQALTLKPEDSATRENLAWVKKKLAKQQKQEAKDDSGNEEKKQSQSQEQNEEKKQSQSQEQNEEKKQSQNQRQNEGKKQSQEQQLSRDGEKVKENDKPASSSGEQGEEYREHMRREEAERLLRSIEGQSEHRYGVRPQFSEPDHPSDKDW